MSAVLALISSLLWGTSDFLGGTASRRLSPYAVIGGSQALALAGLLVVATVTGEWGAPAGYLPWAVASGLTGLVALGAFYAALASGTMGVVAPIAATGVVVPVAVGLARGEAPAPWQYAGMVLAVAGAVLASGPELHPAAVARGGSRRPVLLALVAAAGFGLVLLLVAEGARSSVAMTLLTMRATTVSVLVAVALLRRTAGGLGRRDLPVLTGVGAGDVTANGTYALATHSGLVSLSAVLASLYPAVTVVLARRLHGERMSRLQDAGVATTLLGVVLIAAG